MNSKNISKIAVFGSAKENLSKKIYKVSEEVGQEIAKSKNVLLTGAATGVSRYAAKGAKGGKGMVIGISPTSSNSERELYDISFDDIDFLVHTGMGYKGRNVVSVRSCDGMIVINGNFGTLSEIAIGEGENKPIVAIEGTGGCADAIKSIFSKLNPKYKHFSTASNAKNAVNAIISMIKLVNQ